MLVPNRGGVKARTASQRRRRLVNVLDVNCSYRSYMKCLKLDVSLELIVNSKLKQVNITKFSSTNN